MVNIIAAIIVGILSTVTIGASVIDTPEEQMLGTSQTSSAWFFNGTQIQAALSTWGLRVPQLASCDTIDTDANGVMSCGTDGGGGGSSDSITDADGDTKIQVEKTADEDKIRFDTAGIERMIIDESGNVGIGTTAPDTGLHIKDKILTIEKTTYDFETILNGESVYIRNGYTGSGWARALLGFENATGVDYFGIFGRGTGQTFQYASVGPNYSTAWQVWREGNVGIGTADPQNKLDVNGGAVIGSGYAGIETAPTDGLKVEGEIEADSIITLPNTTASNEGVIYKGVNPFIHDFSHPTGDTAIPQGKNLFIGLDAGNFTMGSAATSIAHGSTNVGIGDSTFSDVTTGYDNVAIGVSSQQNTTTGNRNVSIGFASMLSNTTGGNNTAIGRYAMRFNTTGSTNTAIGGNALYNNTDGDYNTAIGLGAMTSNTEGDFNFGLGLAALSANTTGDHNLGFGYNSGRYIADGSTPNTVSDDSLYLGSNTKALASGDTNEIVIGYEAIGIGSNTVVLGNDSIVTTALKGDVGIDTDSPQNKLDVNGGAVIGSGYAGVETAPTDGLLVEGNVGIGTTSPYAKLSVVGDMVISDLVNCDTIDTDAYGYLSCGTDDGGGSTLHVDTGAFVYPHNGYYHSAPNYIATSTATSSFANLAGVLDASMFDGADIGAKINTAYAALPAQGGKIIVPAGTYSFSTEIEFTTQHKGVLLECAPDGATRLTYTGTTGTSTTYNVGQSDTPANQMWAGGITGCWFYGEDNDYANIGLELGGAYGAQGFQLKDTRWYTFGTGMWMGNNTYTVNIEHNNFNWNGKNVVLKDAPTNSGESIWFSNNLFESYGTKAPGCFDTGSYWTSVQITENSIDDCQLIIGAYSLLTNVVNNHIENPSGDSSSKYTPIVINASTGNEGSAHIEGNTFFQAANTNRPDEYILNEGSHVVIENNTFLSDTYQVDNIVDSTAGGAYTKVSNTTASVNAAAAIMNDLYDPYDNTFGRATIENKAGGTPYILEELQLLNATFASTSYAFISGTNLAVGAHKDAVEVTQYRCWVEGGTSYSMRLTDGTNNTETITCGTSVTSDTDVATNDTFSADEKMYVDFITKTGTVDYVHFQAWGIRQ